MRHDKTDEKGVFADEKTLKVGSRQDNGISLEINEINSRKLMHRPKPVIPRPSRKRKRVADPYVPRYLQPQQARSGRNTNPPQYLLKDYTFYPDDFRQRPLKRRKKGVSIWNLRTIDGKVMAETDHTPLRNQFREIPSYRTPSNSKTTAVNENGSPLEKETPGGRRYTRVFDRISFQLGNELSSPGSEKKVHFFQSSTEQNKGRRQLFTPNKKPDEVIARVPRNNTPSYTIRAVLTGKERPKKQDNNRAWGGANADAVAKAQLGLQDQHHEHNHLRPASLGGEKTFPGTAHGNTLHMLNEQHPASGKPFELKDTVTFQDDAQEQPTDVIETQTTNWRNPETGAAVTTVIDNKNAQIPVRSLSKFTGLVRQTVFGSTADKRPCSEQQDKGSGSSIPVRSSSKLTGLVRPTLFAKPRPCSEQQDEKNGLPPTLVI